MHFARVCICFFTLPAGAFAKYCDEYICHHLCVCLSVRICPEPHGWSLPNVSCMLPMAVSRGVGVSERCPDADAVKVSWSTAERQFSTSRCQVTGPRDRHGRIDGQTAQKGRLKGDHIVVKWIGR